jgi:hypothetical protein
MSKLSISESALSAFNQAVQSSDNVREITSKVLNEYAFSMGDIVCLLKDIRPVSTEDLSAIQDEFVERFKYPTPRRKIRDVVFVERSDGSISKCRIEDMHWHGIDRCWYSILRVYDGRKLSKRHYDADFLEKE